MDLIKEIKEARCFCKQHDLVVMNTWFKKRKTKLYTWKSPGDRKKIPNLLLKQRFRNSIGNVKTLPGADIDILGERYKL